jgi:DNA-binding MarR family transcriptional regulator
MLSYRDCIVFLLAKAYRKAHGVLKRRLSAYGLTPIQALVLDAIREEEGRSAGEIGRRVHLDSATLSGVLDRLAERDWILKEPGEEDKRSLRISLRPKAREVLNALAAERERCNEEILSGFSLEEKILLKRFLRDIEG